MHALKNTVESHAQLFGGHIVHAVILEDNGGCPRALDIGKVRKIQRGQVTANVSRRRMANPIALHACVAVSQIEVRGFSVIRSVEVAFYDHACGKGILHLAIGACTQRIEIIRAELVDVLHRTCRTLDEPSGQMELVVTLRVGGKVAVVVEHIVTDLGYAQHARSVVVVHKRVEQLVGDRVLEGMHALTKATKTEFARVFVAHRVSAEVFYKEVVDVDAYHVTKLVVAIVFNRMHGDVRKRPLRSRLVLGYAILVSFEIVKCTCLSACQSRPLGLRR